MIRHIDLLIVGLTLALGTSVSAQTPNAWWHQVPSNVAKNDGSITLLDANGNPQNMVANPTAGMVKPNQAAITQPPTVIVQATTGYWKDPVANWFSLPSTGNQVGDTRMVTAIGRAFTWNGSSWEPLSVDQNGNMVVPNTLQAASGNITAWDQPTEGGVVTFQGANGVKIHAENNNGTLRLINSAWNAQLLAVDQGGNTLTAGRITSGEFLQSDGVANKGAGCSPNGLFGHDSNGAPLFCQGVWKPVLPQFSISTAVVFGSNNTAEAYCPSGQQVVSGGGACQGGNLESSFWATDGGWYARCNGGAVQVWAGCMPVN